MISSRLKKRVRHFGVSRYCPCCRSFLRSFGPHPAPQPGRVTRPEAKCPVCGALERHRLMELFLVHRTDLFDGRPKSLLHIAPEPVFARRFKAIANLRYVSIDIEAPRRPSLLADITRLPFASGTFDVIYCSHVLEHIPDDHAAMREMHRLLKPTGWSILQVPLRQGRLTYEDPSITTPEARLAAFGQHDHVRDYGDRDYATRLEAAGFAVTVDPFVRQQSVGDQKRFGLMAWEDVHVCRPGLGPADSHASLAAAAEPR